MNRPVLSASNFGAAILCPGKPALESSYGEPPPEPYAIRGTELHRYFKTNLPRGGLSAADRDLLERADAHADKFIGEFLSVAGIDPESPRIEEHEVELKGLGPVPGHPDYVLTWPFESVERFGDFAAVLDLKSGMGDVEEAPSNWQLAVYASLVWRRTPFALCGVAIIQPDAFGPRVTSALYRAEDMSGVMRSIADGKVATLAPDAPRIPGDEQCRYCRAKTVCPEYRDGFEIVSAERPLAVSTLNNLELGTLKKIITRAKELDREVTDELRARVQLGMMPGWKLRNTGSTRTVTDSLSALREIQRYLTNHGLLPMTAKSFDDTRKLVWGDLEALFATLTGYSGKRAKETLKEILAPVTIEMPKSPSVVEDTK